MGPASARRLASSVVAAVAVVAAGLVTVAPSFADATVTVTKDEGQQPFAYEPARVTIAPGESVTWRNPRVHTEMTPPGSAEDHPTNCRQGTSKGKCPWSSEPLPVNGSFTVTFPEEGTFTYFCAVHPYMEGTVVVGDGDPAPAASPEPSPTTSEDPTAPPASDEPSAEPEPTPTSEDPSEPEADEDGADEDGAAEAEEQPGASDEPTDEPTDGATTGPDDDDATTGEGFAELGEDLGEMGEDLGEAGVAIADGVETTLESVMRAAARMFAVVVLLATAAALWVVRRRSTSWED